MIKQKIINQNIKSIIIVIIIIIIDILIITKSNHNMKKILKIKIDFNIIKDIEIKHCKKNNNRLFMLKN